MLKAFYKKSACGLLALGLLIPLSVFAKSVAPGDEFSVSVGCGAVEGSVEASASNATITSSSNWCDRGGTVSATAVAGSAGTASITFTTVDATDTDKMTDVSGQTLGGGSVSVVNPSTPTTPSTGNSGGGSGGASTPGEQTPTQPAKSSDATLSSLSVSAGTLSPKFSANTTKYELSLPSDTKSIVVEAKANDSAASVSGSGEVKLEQGENEIVIRVSAEDGTTKTYTINAYVEEKPELFLDYDGRQLGVVKNTKRVAKPGDAFEEVTLTIDEKEVVGWTNNIMNVTVLYMIDEESGEKGFYLYDSEKQTITSKFQPIALLGNNLYLVDIAKDLQDREGMTFTTVTVDEQELPGWRFNESGFDNYSLIYVMNEKGEMQYYQYESSMNTLQLYSNAAPITTQTYLKNRQIEQIAIIAAGVFAVTTIAALIGCVMIRRRSNLRLRRLQNREE